MKSILFSLAILSVTPTFACDCITLSLTAKYIRSEFVADITITKVYKNLRGEGKYKADIKINELFKGEHIESIWIYGRSDNEMWLSSCDIFIPEKTRLIMYSRKSKNGSFGIGMCSGFTFYKNKKHNKEYEILKDLKSKNISLTNNQAYIEMGNLSEELDQFDGIDLDKKYGIYEITFRSNLSVRKVKKVSGFGDDMDQKLIKILKKTEWQMERENSNEKILGNNKILFGIYYYNKDKEYNSPHV
ncbi:hypothetical protein [Aquimarina algiphila]|uniref:hypothetical protein n=1 Tax=Aquimarina algiphila TaxID=2047982 RepID=UPI0024926243|nr:hypothetical protein [Aquimarina algiphila]